MWGDSYIISTVKLWGYFNPRPTYVRRLESAQNTLADLRISILAPRMWGDPVKITIKIEAMISILAPRMWGDAQLQLFPLLLWIFQSSPHVCEATMYWLPQAVLDEISILAPRMWGDVHYKENFVKKGIFQSSPHVCEATAINQTYACLKVDFNPRPTYVRRLQPSFINCKSCSEAPLKPQLPFSFIVFISSSIVVIVFIAFTSFFFVLSLTVIIV